ncbi:DUF3052 family protein, partial [Streptomyces sp. NPDC006324]
DVADGVVLWFRDEDGDLTDASSALLFAALAATAAAEGEEG